jgi:uncharacterized protein RhaS with RHS repeats
MGVGSPCHYKARVYDPSLGRFLQTDPIGYESDLNLLAYVGNDPVNAIDAFGLDACPVGDRNCVDDPKTEKPGDAPPNGHPVTEEQRELDEVVVTARRDRQIGPDAIDFSLPYPGEQYGAIRGDAVTPVDAKQERKYTCSDGSSGASNVLNRAAFAGADAAVHTHPNWADAGPGGDDGVIPAQLGIPNYGISPSGAWVVESTPSGFRARLISGSWGSSRANVQTAVRGYNTGGGRGLSRKTCTYE